LACFGKSAVIDTAGLTGRNQPEAGSHVALMIGSCWSNAAGHKQQTGQGVSSLGSCAPGLIRIRSLTKTGRFTCWQNFLSDQV